MIKPIKIFLNILLFVLGIVGVFAFSYYDTTTGITIIIMALLFHVNSRIGDLQGKIEDIKLPQAIRPEPESVKSPPAEPKPLPPAVEPEVFKCKKCQKEFPEEKKLKRHFGMVHYQDLEV